MASMVGLSCETSLVVMEQEITGRDTPQARPSAILLKSNRIEIVSCRDLPRCSSKLPLGGRM